MSGYRIDRTLLLERDPEKLAERPSLQSLRDADWRHQQAAMVRGYNSLAEMAIDELIGLVRELQERLDRLESVEIYGMSLADRATHARGELEQ